MREGFARSCYFAAIFNGRMQDAVLLSDLGAKLWFTTHRALPFSTRIVHALVEPVPSVDHWAIVTQICQKLSDLGISFEVLRTSIPMITPNSDSNARQKSINFLNGYIGFSATRVLRETLPLKNNFEEFMMSLGANTRRNFRRYRRKARETGLRHEIRWRCSFTDTQEWKRLCREVQPNSREYEKCCRVSSSLHNKENFYSLIWNKEGELVACCGGLIGDESAFIFYQLNDERYKRSSLSLLNNSFLFEALIGRGIVRAVLPQGGVGVLMDFFEAKTYMEILVMRKTAKGIVLGFIFLLLRLQNSIVRQYILNLAAKN